MLWFAGTRYDNLFCPKTSRSWHGAHKCGKCGATLVETDADFNVLLKALLKKRTLVSVQIPFDVDKWGGASGRG